MNPAIDLKDLMVPPEATILEVMKVIDHAGLEVALVCDRQDHLLAVVTDGDIRRALIRGTALDQPIGDVGNKRFTAVRPDTNHAEAIETMVKRRFKCLPVTDQLGRLVDLHTLNNDLIVMGDRTESWAVIMAGGRGERLGELTQGIPKPMLPVGDKPILEHLVRLLVGYGVRRIFIAVNYLGRMIEDHFGDGHDYACAITYLHEREDRPLGTGGALALLPEKPAHPLIVMNGDLLTRINIGRLLKFHRAGGFVATMGLREHVVQVPFGVVEVETKDVEVCKLAEKPRLSFQINSGIYVLNPELLAEIPKDRLFPITELLDACIKSRRKVGAYNMQEPWTDIGLPEEYRQAQQG